MGSHFFVNFNSFWAFCIDLIKRGSGWRSVLYSGLLYSTLLFSTLLFSSLLYSTLLYSTLLL